MSCRSREWKGENNKTPKHTQQQLTLPRGKLDSIFLLSAARAAAGNEVERAFLSFEALALGGGPRGQLGGSGSRGWQAV